MQLKRVLNFEDKTISRTVSFVDVVTVNFVMFCQWFVGTRNGSFNLSNHCVSNKVELFWEGHRLWKNLPLVLMLLSKNSCFVKTSGRFFQIFIALSKCLNFTMKKGINYSYVYKILLQIKLFYPISHYWAS